MSSEHSKEESGVVEKSLIQYLKHTFNLIIVALCFENVLQTFISHLYNEESSKISLDYHDLYIFLFALYLIANMIRYLLSSFLEDMVINNGEIHGDDQSNNIKGNCIHFLASLILLSTMTLSSISLSKSICLYAVSNSLLLFFDLIYIFIQGRHSGFHFFSSNKKLYCIIGLFMIVVLGTLYYDSFPEWCYFVSSSLFVLCVFLICFCQGSGFFRRWKFYNPADEEDNSMSSLYGRTLRAWMKIDYFELICWFAIMICAYYDKYILSLFYWIGLLLLYVSDFFVFNKSFWKELCIGGYSYR